MSLLGMGAGSVAAQPSPGGGRRLALVVGNDAYSTPLPNAVNDARSMSDVLTRDGFAVTLKTDQSKSSFLSSFGAFTDTIEPGDVALVYYAGHGLQLGGTNYLEPIDFHAATPQEATLAGVAVSDLLEQIGRRKPSLTVLILDTCRNNPFTRTAGTPEGLASMSPGTGHGGIIAFSTGPGDTARDDQDGLGNGLFTTFLVQALRIPGLTADEVFAYARQKVYETTGGDQHPQVTTSAIGEFRFLAGKERPADGTTDVTRPPDQVSKAPGFWAVGGDQDANETELRRLLMAYQAANNARDASALLEVLPRASKAEVQGDFKAATRIDMSMTCGHASYSGLTATVHCVVLMSRDTTREGHQDAIQAYTTFVFSKKGGGWRLDHLE